MTNDFQSYLRRYGLLLGACAIAHTVFAWDFAEYRKIGDRAMSLLPR